MNDRDEQRAAAIREIAAILATAYLRLRFPEILVQPVDCAGTQSDSCVSRLTL